MKVAVRAALLAGAVLVATAALPTAAPAAARAVPGPTAAPVDARLAAVQAVLDTRSSALRAGDRPTWLATVDPRAPASFVAAELRRFDGLRQLPLATLRFVARLAGSGDLAGGLASAYGGAPVFLPETRQIWRLDGYDDRDAVDALWLTFVQRGGRWYVGGDSDLSAVGLDTQRYPWEFEPIELQGTPHFLVVDHPAQHARAAALAATAEAAIAILAQRWHQPWLGRIPIILPGSVGELEQLLQSTIDLSKFVAFTAYGAVTDDGYVATAPRIYIQDAELARNPPVYQLLTLVHELSHAAGVPVDGPNVPAWVHEGLADWIARGQATSERRPAGSDDAFPRDYQFVTGSGPSIVRVYGEARTVMSTLAAARGLAAPGAFFAALGALRTEPGSADYLTDQALRQSAGLAIAELRVRWDRR